MKKNFFLLSTIILLCYIASFGQEIQCVSCTHNNIDFTKYASGVGSANQANGLNSFVGGNQSHATGDYSFAFGSNASATGLSSISLMKNSLAIGMYSFAAGKNSVAIGNAAFALGYYDTAQAGGSYVFGEYLKTTASGSMIVGIGSGSGSGILKNNNPYSLMVGFKSRYPTLVVGTSPSDMLTGDIGVGNISIPQAKLHILGDDDADRPYNASLYIQSAGDYYSTVFLGDKNHFFKTKPGQDLEFNAAGHDFYFNNGNVGIGIDDPLEKLEVNGNIQADEISVTGFTLNYGNPSDGQLLQYNAEGSASWVDPAPTDDGDWTISENGVWTNGNVGVGMLPGGTKALEVNGDINLTGDLYKQGSLMDFTQWENNGNDLHYDTGNVGLGTGVDDPDANFHIKDYSGNVDKTILKIESSEEPGNGSTEIGREEGNGPVIIQRAGNINFNDGGPRLSFQQKSRTEQVGLSLSTYTKITGAINVVDLVAVNGGLYLRSLHDFHIKAGGNNPLKFYTQCTDGKSSGILRMEINSDGQVGIGTTIHSDQDTKLTVAGRIHAQEVKVTAGAGTGADFVFEEDYDLPNIEQVADYIRMHKHLPDIQSAAEMQEQGLDLGEMQIKLLQKIEELTLYVIDLKKENEEMREEIEKLIKE